MTDRLEKRLNDYLTEKSFPSDTGWALVPLAWADVAVFTATKSRRRWRLACFALAALLVLGVLAYVMLH